MMSWVVSALLATSTAVLVTTVFFDIRRRRTWHKHTALVRGTRYECPGKTVIAVLDLTWFERGIRRNAQIRTAPVYQAFN